MDIGSLTGTVSLEDQFSEALTVATEKIKSFAEEFEGMAGTVVIGAGVMTAAIVGAVVSIEALGNEGSKILGVENAFDKLAESAGTTGEALRHGLMDGVKGTIDDMVLMQSTSKLLGSGMQLTADQATLMGAAARELGKATGGDAASGLNILSGALTTGRTRSLQMQGILVDVAAGEQKFADSIGTTVDQLSTAGQLEGKRIAILEATQGYLDRLGTSELSFAEKIKQGWTALDEWGDSLKKAVASSPDVMQALDTIGAAISSAFGGNSQSVMDTIVEGINAFARGVTAAVPYVVSFGEGVKTVWNFLADHIGIIVDTTKVVGTFGAAWLVWGAGGALVTGIVGGFTAITASITAITVAIAANPLGVAVISAVALGTAISTVANHYADAALAEQVAGAKQDALNRSVAEGTKATDDHTKSTADNSAAQDDNTKFLKDRKSAVDALVKALEGDTIALQNEGTAIDQVIASGTEDINVKTRVIDAIDKLVSAHVKLSAEAQHYYDINSQLGTAEIAEAEKVTEAWAKADEAQATLLKSRASQHETALLARNELELAYDAKLVSAGIMSQTQYNSIKKKLDDDAFNEHVDMLHKEEAAELTSNGVKMDAELAKLDTRYAQGKVKTEAYEQEYAAITAKYAAQRAGVEDNYTEKINASQQKQTIAMIGNWTSVGLAASQYAQGITMAQAAIEGDLNSQLKIVHTLAGEWLDAADAKRRFDQGNTLDLATAARDPEIMGYLLQGWSLVNAEALKYARQWNFLPKLYDLLGNPENMPSADEGVPGYFKAIATTSAQAAQATTTSLATITTALQVTTTAANTASAAIGTATGGKVLSGGGGDFSLTGNDLASALQDSNSKASFQKRRDDAKATFDFMTAHSDQYTAIDIKNSADELAARTTDLKNWQSVATASITSVLSTYDKQMMAMGFVKDSSGTWQGVSHATDSSGAALNPVSTPTVATPSFLGSQYQGGKDTQTINLVVDGQVLSKIVTQNIFNTLGQRV